MWELPETSSWQVARLRFKSRLSGPQSQCTLRQSLLTSTGDEITTSGDSLIHIMRWVEYVLLRSRQWLSLPPVSDCCLQGGVGGVGFPRQPTQVVTLSRIPLLTSCQYAASSRHLVCSGSGRSGAETWLHHSEEFEKIRQETDASQSVLPKQTRRDGVGFHWRKRETAFQNKYKGGENKARRNEELE